MKNLKKIAVAVAIAAASGLAQADYNPYGVQNDVAWADVVTNGGWSVVYQDYYGDAATSISSIFGSIAAGSKVMLAAMNVGDSGNNTFDVLAWATKEQVLTYTGSNVTHQANGAEWYFNGLSMGFAGAGDSIEQYTADVNGQDERDRLSWHTSLNGGWVNQDAGYAPNYLDAGWRSGNNLWLNDSSTWKRYVLVQGGVNPAVPEPETYGMMMAGLGLIGFMARRRKQQQA